MMMIMLSHNGLEKVVLVAVVASNLMMLMKMEPFTAEAIALLPLHVTLTCLTWPCTIIHQHPFAGIMAPFSKRIKMIVLG